MDDTESARWICFIRQDKPSEGDDLFAHATTMVRGDDTTFEDLAVGDRVEFERARSPRKTGSIRSTQLASHQALILTVQARAVRRPPSASVIPVPHP